MGVFFYQSIPAKNVLVDDTNRDHAMLLQMLNHLHNGDMPQNVRRNYLRICNRVAKRCGFETHKSEFGYALASDISVVERNDAGMITRWIAPSR